MMEARAPGPAHPRRTGLLRQLEARSDPRHLGPAGRHHQPDVIGCGRYDGIAPFGTGGHGVSIGGELHVYQGGHAFWPRSPAFDDVVGFLQACSS